MPTRDEGRVMADVIPEGFELMDVKGAILKLEPNDILVIQAKDPVSVENIARMKDVVASQFGLKCLVLGDDLQLKVLRPSPPDEMLKYGMQ